MELIFGIWGFGEGFDIIVSNESLMCMENCFVCVFDNLIFIGIFLGSDGVGLEVFF